MPLTDEQAMAFIREGQNRGLDSSSIKSALEKEGVGLSVNVGESPMKSAAIASEPTAPGAPWTQKDTYKLERGALTVGGGLAAAAMTGGASVPWQIGAEALGSVGGRAIGNAVTDKPTTDKLVQTGVGSVLGSVGGRVVSALASRLAGISPELAKHVGDMNPINAIKTVTVRPGNRAELTLGESIQSALGRLSDSITGGRLDKQAMMASAEKSGVKIDVAPVVQSLMSKMASGGNASEPSAQAFNRSIVKFAKSLYARGQASGGLTPRQFDKFMIDELDSKVFTGSGDVSSARMGGALADVRATAKQTFEKAMEDAGYPGFKGANAAASEELGFRSEADMVFGPGKLSLEQRIRNLFKPGHEKEKEILKRIGDESGIDLLGQAKDLASRRSFTRDPREADSAMGIMREVLFAPLAKGISKVASPVQRYVGPAVAGAVSARSDAQTKVLEDAMRNSP